jgi:hypothetical protein
MRDFLGSHVGGHQSVIRTSPEEVLKNRLPTLRWVKSTTTLIWSSPPNILCKSNKNGDLIFKMTRTFANNTGDIMGLPIWIIANQRQETWPMASMNPKSQTVDWWKGKSTGTMDSPLWNIGNFRCSRLGAFQHQPYWHPQDSDDDWWAMLSLIKHGWETFSKWTIFFLEKKSTGDFRAIFDGWKPRQLHRIPVVRWCSHIHLQICGINRCKSYTSPSFRAIDTDDTSEKQGKSRENTDFLGVEISEAPTLSNLVTSASCLREATTSWKGPGSLREMGS